MQKITPLARKNNLVVQELNNEILIYDLETNKVFGLNETSALVWQFSDGKRNTAEIAQIVSKKLSYPIQEDFVWLALGRLKKEKLIDNDIPESFQGANRREVIRRIGLASMIALPMVSSLIAPSALQAQSAPACGTAPNIALGCSCVVGGLPNSANCESKCCEFVLGTQTGTCIQKGTVAAGGSCIRSCQCSNNCCFNGACATTTGKGSGASCLNSCECASNLCTSLGVVPGTCN